eukprot:gene4107-8163_t
MPRFLFSILIFAIAFLSVKNGIDAKRRIGTQKDDVNLVKSDYLGNKSIEPKTSKNPHVSCFNPSLKGKSSGTLNCIPEVLEFHEVRVCMPQSEYFVIQNPMATEISIHSITSSSLQFHPVFSTPKVLLPGESLSIEVVFFPYYVETSKANISVLSTVGSFYYQMVGQAIQNPHHLHPFTGMKLVSGASYEQPLIMYNPYSEILYIREIFTTEDFLTLMGSAVAGMGGQTVSTDIGLFQVGPGETTEVIKILISATIPGNYHGYVHIRTDKGKSVVPVEVSILEGGLRSMDPVIDFGTMTSQGDEKSIELRLINNGSVDVLVHEVVSLSPDAQLAINMSPSPVVVRVGEQSVVALLVHKSATQGKISNKLLVLTNNSNPALATLEVPYEVTVLHGGIGFEHGLVQFFLPIRNRTLPSVSAISCGGLVSLESIPDMTTAQPLQKWAPVVLKFNKGKAMKDLREKLPYSCALEVWTNVSTHRIPLQFLDGRALFFCSAYEDVPGAPPKEKWCSNSDSYRLHVGKISAARPRPIAAHFINPNPVTVRLSMAQASQPVCLCLEALIKSPVPNNSVVAPVMNNALPSDNMNTNINTATAAASHSVGDCICYPHDLMVRRSKSYSDRFRGGAKKVEVPTTYLDITGGHNFALSVQLDPQSLESNNVSIRIGTPFQVLEMSVEFEAQSGHLQCYFVTATASSTTTSSSSTTTSSSSSSSPANMNMNMMSHFLLMNDVIPLKLNCLSSYPMEIPMTSLAVSAGTLPAANVRAHVVSHILRPDLGVVEVALLEVVLSTFNTSAFPSSTTNEEGMSNALIPPLVNRSPTVYHTRQLTAIGRLVYCHNRESYETVNQLLSDIDRSIASDRPSVAFDGMMELKLLLSNLFPRKDYFPSFAITVKSTVTFSTATTEPLQLQLALPIDYLPSEHVISLPVIRKEMVSLVYFEIHNPFDRPMQIRLRTVSTTDGGIASDAHSYASLVGAAIPLPTKPGKGLSVTAVTSHRIFNNNTTGESEENLNRNNNNTNGTNGSGRDSSGSSSQFVKGTGSDYHNDNDGHNYCTKTSSSSSSSSSPNKEECPPLSSESSQTGTPDRSGSSHFDFSVIKGAFVHSSLRPRVQVHQAGKYVDVDDPFVVRSSSTEVWVALPYQSLVIGPVAYVPLPLARNAAKVLGQRHSTTIFMVNDITGVDRVRLEGEWGTAQLDVETNPCAKSSADNGDTATATLGDDQKTQNHDNSLQGKKLYEPSSSSSSLSASASAAAIGINNESPEFIDPCPNVMTQLLTNPSVTAFAPNITVISQGIADNTHPFQVIVRNSGSLPVPLSDMLVDGVHCQDLIASRHRVWVANCSQLPVTLDPGASWVTSIAFFVDCTLLKERRGVSFRSAHIPPRHGMWGWSLTWTWGWVWGATQQGHHDIELKVSVDVKLSKEKTYACIHGDTSTTWSKGVMTYTMYALMSVLLVMAVFLLVQLHLTYRRTINDKKHPSAQLPSLSLSVNENGNENGSVGQRGVVVLSPKSLLSSGTSSPNETTTTKARNGSSARPSLYLRPGVFLDDVLRTPLTEVQMIRSLDAVHRVKPSSSSSSSSSIPVTPPVLTTSAAITVDKTPAAITETITAIVTSTVTVTSSPTPVEDNTPTKKLNTTNADVLSSPVVIQSHPQPLPQDSSGYSVRTPDFSKHLDNIIGCGSSISSSSSSPLSTIGTNTYKDKDKDTASTNLFPSPTKASSLDISQKPPLSASPASSSSPVVANTTTPTKTTVSMEPIVGSGSIPRQSVINTPAVTKTNSNSSPYSLTHSTLSSSLSLSPSLDPLLSATPLPVSRLSAPLPPPISPPVHPIRTTSESPPQLPMVGLIHDPLPIDPALFMSFPERPVGGPARGNSIENILSGFNNSNNNNGGLLLLPPPGYPRPYEPQNVCDQFMEDLAWAHHPASTSGLGVDMSSSAALNLDNEGPYDNSSSLFSFPYFTHNSAESSTNMLLSDVDARWGSDINSLNMNSMTMSMTNNINMNMNMTGSTDSESEAGELRRLQNLSLELARGRGSSRLLRGHVCDGRKSGGRKHLMKFRTKTTTDTLVLTTDTLVLTTDTLQQHGDKGGNPINCIIDVG